MKKILLTALTLAIALSGCQSDDTDLYSSSTETPSVGINDSELLFEGKTEDALISIKANFWWKATVVYPSGSTEEWCHLSPDSGYGNIEIRVTSSRNYGLVARNATIVITNDGGDTPFRKEFTVTQTPSSPYIEITEVPNNGTYDVPVTATENMLELMSNKRWAASSDQNWCTVTASGDEGKTSFEVNCDLNSTQQPRAAVITVSALDTHDLSYRFTVRQGEKFEQSTLTVAKSPTTFSASWSAIVGAVQYLIDVYDADNTLRGTIDAGMALSCDLAQQPIFSIPTYAGYVNLVVRTLSDNPVIYSESEPVASNSHFTSGKGTSADPFIIGDIQSLTNITAANKVAANAGAYYKLDFTPSLTATFVPVCTPEAPFKGIFDGAGKTISGWAQSIKADERNYTGLFGGVDTGASVSNLTFTNCSIALDKGPGSISSTNNGFAFVASLNKGTISNITLTNPSITTVKGTAVLAAGIAAVNQGTISNCKSTGGIFSSASDRNKSDKFQCGGIAAENSTTGIIDGCSNGTEILACSDIGGIVGVNDGKINGSSNHARITGNYYIGGISGNVKTTSNNTSFLISNCYNTGDIVMDEPSGQSMGAAYVGGIAGLMRSRGDAIVNCFNSGNLTVGASSSSSNVRVGGIAGRTQDTGVIRNCYSSGTFTVTGRIDLGGIIGLMDSGATVENCYATETLIFTGTYSGNIGDAIGRLNSGTVVSSYSANSGAGGFIGSGSASDAVSGRKTTAELQGVPTASVFVDWDFTSIWQQSPNTGYYPYPYLRGMPHKKSGE